jgi:hypothetical protein
LADRAATKQGPAQAQAPALAHLRKEGKENIYFIA